MSRTTAVGVPIRGRPDDADLGQPPVIDKDLTAPPGAPSLGDRYIVASVASGAWTGQEDDIAQWAGSAWVFETPIIGVWLYVEDENEYYSWNGTAWVQESAGPHATTHEEGGADIVAAASGAHTVKFDIISPITYVSGKLGVGIAAPVSPCHIYQDDAASSFASGLTIEQDGGGDAVINFLLSGGRRALLGLDNSDDDILVLSYGLALGADLVCKFPVDGILLPDGNKAIFGSAADAVVYYDGTNLIIDPAVVGSGYVSIGTGSPGHSPSADGLFVGGILEVDGRAWFDSIVNVDTTPGGTGIFWFSEAGSARGGIIAMFGQEAFHFHVGGELGGQVIFTSYENRTKDHDHAPQTDPTVYVHSATDPDSDASEWVSLTHDKTKGVIAVGKGDLGLACGTEKTLVLAETVWEDINFGSGQAQVPASSAPDIVTFLDNLGADTDIATRGFAVGEKLSFSAEYIHRAKTDGDIIFHVHIQGDAAPTGTDKIKFQIKYTITRDGVTCPPVTTITKEIDFDTQYAQEEIAFAAITGSGIQMGDEIRSSLERIAASADEYGGDAKIVTFGAHVEVDTMGSRQVTAK